MTEPQKKEPLIRGSNHLAIDYNNFSCSQLEKIDVRLLFPGELLYGNDICYPLGEAANNLGSNIFDFISSSLIYLTLFMSRDPYISRALSKRSISDCDTQNFLIRFEKIHIYIMCLLDCQLVVRKFKYELIPALFMVSDFMSFLRESVNDPCHRTLRRLEHIESSLKSKLEELKNA